MPLTYCLNTHPGETWSENLTALRTIVLAVRDLVSPGKPFGLGLRLSAAAALELDNPGRIAELREFLDSEKLFVFTINGFPFGPFHGVTVKENVYAPDWRTPDRRDYTNHLANILAALIPRGGAGSISTLPGSWKPWITTPADLAAILDHITDCAAHCAAIAFRDGREILLALEPEPGCLLETTAETIRFFTESLFTEGARLLGKKIHRPESAARTLIQRHIGVCLDTCHAALAFEDPGESLRAYEAAGIRVPKVQVSSALRTANTPAGLEALRAFAEPVYLHQVRARTDAGGLFAWNDLPQALAQLPETAAREVRVHFHVPLHFTAAGPLTSTGALITPQFIEGLRRDPGAHIEIETYTWHVLPDSLRSSSIERSIAAEFQWIETR